VYLVTAIFLVYDTGVPGADLKSKYKIRFTVGMQETDRQKGVIAILFLMPSYRIHFP